VGHEVWIREIKNLYKILVGKPEGKRPLGKPWHRWEHNIKMGLKYDMDWNLLAQDTVQLWTLVNTVIPF